MNFLNIILVMAALSPVPTFAAEVPEALREAAQVNEPAPVREPSRAPAVIQNLPSLAEVKREPAMRGIVQPDNKPTVDQIK